MKITFTVDTSSHSELIDAREVLGSMYENLCGVPVDLPPENTTPPDAEVPTPPPPSDPPPPPSDPPPPPMDVQTEIPTPPPPDAAPPPPPGPPVELDSSGRPWDERFHAGSKKQIKDGTWRRKRKVSEADVERGMPLDAAPPGPVVPKTPPLAPPPPGAAAPPADGAVSWPDVIQAYESRASKYTHEQIAAAVAAAGLPKNTFGQPELYSSVLAALNAGCPL